MHKKVMAMIDEINSIVESKYLDDHIKKDVVYESVFREKPEYEEITVKVCKFCKNEMWGFGKHIIGQFCCKEMESHFPQFITEYKRKEKECYDEEESIRIMNKTNIPKRFLKATLSDFEAMPLISGYVEKYETMTESGVGLYIQGSPGSGKTHLSCAIVKEIIRQYQIPKIHIAKFSDIILRLKKAFDVPDVSELDIIQEISSYNLLVIDDLGKEHITDWSKKMIHYIIDKRYEEMRPIIYTSIFQYTDLKSTLLADTIGRIAESTSPFILKSKNRRGV